jgi:DNA-directed RNA polymerase sigma subunit (sigma70/sigma32)
MTVEAVQEVFQCSKLKAEGFIQNVAPYIHEPDPLSLDHPVRNSSDSQPLQDIIADPAESPYDDVIQRDLIERLLDYLRTTRYGDWKVSIVRMYFGLDTGEKMSYEDIGRSVGFSREWVRLLMNTALRDLRTYTADLQSSACVTLDHAS